MSLRDWFCSNFGRPVKSDLVVFPPRKQALDKLPLAAVLAFLFGSIALILILKFIPGAEIIVVVFQAIAPLILIIVTAVYVVETNDMVQEMKKGRELEVMPHLFFMVKEFQGEKWFAVKNTGLGPAFGIELNYGEKTDSGASTNNVRIEYLGKDESKNYPSEQIKKFTSYSKLYVTYQFETLLGKRISGEEATMAGDRFFPGECSQLMEAKTKSYLINKVI